MEAITMLLRTVSPGKPSISMGHLYHGYVSHNQRVNGALNGKVFHKWRFIAGEIIYKWDM
jgi:hypothetical protein